VTEREVEVELTLTAAEAEALWAWANQYNPESWDAFRSACVQLHIAMVDGGANVALDESPGE
jgi:hypothetical protein